jgi:hypothetical protein
LVLAFASVTPVAASAAAATRVSLKPGSGRPTTTFVVRFRAPVRTGTFGTLTSHYRLYASGPKGRGCLSNVSITLRATRRHAHVRVSLNPKRLGNPWCAGRFHGRIVETQAVICRKPLACPQIVIAPRTIARFSFRVKNVKAGKGGGPPQKTGPTFAGLQSATTCSTVTPKVQLKGKIYTLTWTPAIDPVTPSSKLVYDIYYSAKSGGENFTKSTLTTSPGATSDTVTLAGSGAAYFVVRARDQAGLEDQNTVERAAVNTC